jgi:glycosyltransferase involved in cell wall biosynthesis
VLLDAVAQLVRDGLAVHWVICGDGSLRAELESRVNDLGLSSHVTFTGFSSDVPSLLPGADVFVLPSLHEGLGIAAMEAMAAGLPVVASKVGGLPEIVDDGDTGLLVPPGDAAAFATALRRIAGDPAWAQQLAQRGHARALARFTSRAMAEAVEAYYYELLT